MPLTLLQGDLFQLDSKMVGSMFLNALLNESMADSKTVR